VAENEIVGGGEFLLAPQMEERKMITSQRQEEFASWAFVPGREKEEFPSRADMTSG